MLHIDEHSQALLPLTNYFVIYSLHTPQFYINHSHLHTYYPGNLYHQILLDYLIQTHFKLRLSDQNYQRYVTSPFSSLKSSYFTSSWQSQEHYLLVLLFLLFYTLFYLISNSLLWCDKRINVCYYLHHHVINPESEYSTLQLLTSDSR